MTFWIATPLKLSHLVIVTSLSWWVSEVHSFFSSTGAHCVAHPSIEKLDKEKSKHVGLAQQNGFFWPSKTKLNEGNPKNMPLWFSKMVFAPHFSTCCAEASKKAQQNPN
jgi:hypothetical protein